MILSDLRVNQLISPLGYDYSDLSLSWILCLNEQNKLNLGIEYTEIKILEGNNELYVIKEYEEINTIDYKVKIELKPRTKYEWFVTVALNDGTSVTEKSCFETGKLQEEWIGKWISSSLDKEVTPIFKNKFRIESSETSHSRLYICGLGVYEVYINNMKVGDEFLAPGYHSYDFHLQTSTYDISKYLKDGENEIKIWLGDGWFKGRLGFDGGYTNLYGDNYYAIFELYVDDKLVLTSNENFECIQSPIVFSNIYDGEIFDSRIVIEEKGRKVNLDEPKKCSNLCDRFNLEIVKKEIFEVQEVIKTPKMEYVLDFGQNLTGWVEFNSKMPIGYKLKLTASEIMQNGCFYRENLRTAKAEYIFISNGVEQSVRPKFTFFGFRYMNVEVFDENDVLVNTDILSDINVFGFKAYHLRSNFDEIGKIETGIENVNKLFSNVMWGQKGNFLDVPTDCPQRDERLGWTGDAQIFSDTACYNMYMPGFFRKYLWDMRAEQSILKGSGPNVVPRLKEGLVAEHGASPWADAAVIIPWNVYLHYGSVTLLRECYSGMRDWVDCVRRKEEKLGGLHLVKDGFHFADWLALDNEKPGPFGATDPLYIASAYYYNNAKIIAESAGILGLVEESKVYEEISIKILDDIRATYFDENGLCKSLTQTASAIAIMFELTENIIGQGEVLNRQVLENNNHLNTGFVGTMMLCPALSKTGHHQRAVDLLLNDDYPSWLYSVKLEATTIWERWNSVLEDGTINEDGMNSLNHYSYGSIAGWMYGYLCGIRPIEAGYKKAIIEPKVDKRLGFVNCELKTSSGRYKVAWKFKDEKAVFDIEVPFGAKADFVLEGSKESLTFGKYRFESIGGKYVKREV